MRLDGVSEVRDFYDGELVFSSSSKKRSRPRLANNFSSEVSRWFIDDSFEETSSFVSSSAFSSYVSSFGKSEESSSLPSTSESRSLFLAAKDSTSSSKLRLTLLSLDAILWRREIVGRERVIGWIRENAAEVSAIWDGGGRGD
jgi:hypothetical protein